jgi:hypothetical protein
MDGDVARPLTNRHPADLASKPFIVMKEEHCLGDQVLRFFDRAMCRPTF